MPLVLSAATSAERPVAEESLSATREYTGTAIAMMRVEFTGNCVAIEGSRKALAESYLLLRKLRNAGTPGEIASA
jgi:hypothetical protein